MHGIRVALYAFLTVFAASKERVNEPGDCCFLNSQLLKKCNQISESMESLLIYLLIVIVRYPTEKFIAFNSALNIAERGNAVSVSDKTRGSRNFTQIFALQKRNFHDLSRKIDVCTRISFSWNPCWTR